MAYYTKNMLTDASGKRLIPQYYDPATDSYKPLTNLLQLADGDGQKININNRLPVDIGGTTINATIGDQQAKLANVILQDGNTIVSVGTPFAVLSYKTLTIEITGTSTSRTIQFEGSSVSGTYYAIQGVKLQDLSMNTQTTGNNEVWSFDITGLVSFRANVTQISGGNISVKGKAVA